MSASTDDGPQPTTASQIDGPWDRWMNALMDVLKGYDKVSYKWFWWRVNHICKGFEDAGCVSYAKWLRPNQVHRYPLGPPPHVPDLIHNYPPPIGQPPNMEIAALRAVKTCLEYIYDDPANHRTPVSQEPLSPDQKKEFRALEKAALDEVNDRLRVLVSMDSEEKSPKSALEKLTAAQRELVRYLHARDGKQAPIREAMLAFRKKPGSKREWKSFLATVRRLNARLDVYYPDLEIELNRTAKTISLLEKT